MKELKTFINESMNDAQWLRVAEKVRKEAEHYVGARNKKCIMQPVFVEDEASYERYYAIPYVEYKTHGVLIGIDERGDVKNFAVFKPNDTPLTKDASGNALYYIDGESLGSFMGSDSTVSSVSAFSLAAGLTSTDLDEFINNLMYQIEHNEDSEHEDDILGDIQDEIEDAIENDVKYTII